MTNTSPSEIAKAPKPLALVVLMGLSAGFTLGGYELVRSPANSLFAQFIGKSSLPLVTTLIPVAVALVAVMYAKTLSAVGPRRTLFWCTGASTICLAAAGYLAQQGISWVLWPLYLFKEAYIVLLIEQYWSYINSSLTERDSRRFNGLICGIASIGSVLGGIVGSYLTRELGSAMMVVMGAVMTLPSMILTEVSFRRVFMPQGLPVATKVSGRWWRDLGGSAFRRETILILILGVVCVSQAVGTLLGLTFQGVLLDHYPSADQQSEYSYQFYAWINGVAGVLQFIGAPILLTILAPLRVLLLIPVLHLVVIAVAVWFPSITTWGLAFAAFKCVDYSIFRAAKEVLYVPLSFDARYRAKEVIDMFGYRFSKGATSGIVSLLLAGGFLLTDHSYGIAALAGAILWLTITAYFIFFNAGKQT
jgi:AAA family ATP:ADP antiporter